MANISYIPTVWADGAEGGTPIDAAKLNNIESGIVDAVAAIGPNDATEDGTLKAQIDALKNSAYRYTNNPNITDLNQLVDNGVYSVYPGASNAPSSAWQAVLVMRFDNSPNYVAQLAIDMDGKAFCRSCSSGVWSAWRQL